MLRSLYPTLVQMIKPLNEMETIALTSMLTPGTARETRWATAIPRRTSVRTYDGSPLSPAQALALRSLGAEALGTARVRAVLLEGAEATEAIFKGLVGSYGRLIGTPALIALVAHTQDPGYMAEVGYLGEQWVLEATALGLATCWVAGSFRRETAAEYISLSEGEQIVAVIAVGRAAGGSAMRRLHDQSMRFFVSSAKRKPLDELVSGEVMAAWQAEALEAARWAPSANNAQPWRFTVVGEGVRIAYTPSGKAGTGGEDHRALDCGIAMVHVATSARAQGVPGVWRLLDSGDALAEFRPE